MNRSQRYSNWRHESSIPIFNTSLSLLLHEQRSNNNTLVIDTPYFLKQILAFVTKKLGEKESEWKSLLMLPKETKADLELDVSCYERLCNGDEMDWDGVPGSVVVLFLRLVIERLPEPLLTFELTPYFFASLSLPVESAPYFLASLVQALPQVNLDVFQKLMNLFSLVGDIAVVRSWAPALILRDFRNPEPWASRRAIKVLENIFRFCTLIFSHNSDQISRLDSKKKNKIKKDQPYWIIKENTKQQQILLQANQRVSSVISYLRQMEVEINTDLREYITHFKILELELDLVRENFDPKTHRRLIDTYHLQKGLRYLCDLDEFIHGVEERKKGMLSLLFENLKLRRALDVLRVHIDHEITLFTKFALSSLGILYPTEKLHELMFQHLLHENAKQWWISRFGSTYTVGWNFFIDNFVEEIRRNPNFDDFKEVVRDEEKWENKLKQVLDPTKTGVVTLWRFGFFCMCFRKNDLAANFTNAIFTVMQEWFHPYVSHNFLVHLFAPKEIGTFTVRFSATQPGKFVLERKNLDESNQAVFISVNEDGDFTIKEAEDKDYSKSSLITIINYYHQTGQVKSAFHEKFIHHTAFYGLLSGDQTALLLANESHGTFIFRFTQGRPNHLVLSFVTEKGLNNCLILRDQNGAFVFEKKQFNHLDDIISKFSKSAKGFLTKPFKFKFSLELSLELEFTKSKGYLNTKLANFFSSSLPPEPEDIYESVELSDILKALSSVKIGSQTYKELEEAVVEKCFGTEEKNWITIHDSVINNKKLPKSVKLSPRCYSHTSHLNKVRTFEFFLSDSKKRHLKYKVLNPVQIDADVFFSVHNPEGQLDKNNNSAIIYVSVVLHTLVELKKCLILKCEVTEKDTVREISFYLPCCISFNPLNLENEKTFDPFWNIPYTELVETDTIAQGSTAKEEICLIKRVSLYGATIALKQWSISKSGLPRDYIHEKTIFMQIPPHKSIIPFVGIVETEVTCSLAIEFCPNKTLDDTIKEIQESEAAGIEKNDEDSSASDTSSNTGTALTKKTSMSWNRMLEISLTVATGIYEMHRVNLIHRDLKSRNLLLDDFFKIKICDFGETCYVKTRLPSQKGTPGWIAPEVQLLECYTTKADVFSFGVLLWQLLTKQQPPLEPFFTGDIFLNSLPYEEHNIGRGIVELARLCLDTVPSKRPSFQFIVQKLLLLEQTPKKLSTSKKKKPN